MDSFNNGGTTFRFLGLKMKFKEAAAEVIRMNYNCRMHIPAETL